ncbi:hypothetical protein T440DRAFT_470379 [Plenodomus tracheiphilus IPT5]|uniref:Uncharacterized protein n=1 Tax=Plenodomus tracheiphilus IPT5 TaxID=1408161 RepID=A0A6A7B1H5_9PLEO|nr:hypothetical protein T440DRAFT_470379 [Plenodomus tracheiphilus IPT5]
MEPQILTNRYINNLVLTRLLTSLFGSDFEFEVEDENFILRIPRQLTEDEINQLQKDSKQQPTTV